MCVVTGFALRGARCSDEGWGKGVNQAAFSQHPKRGIGWRWCESISSKKGKIKKYVVLFRPSWSHGLWCRLLFLIWIFEKTIDMFVLFCHLSGAVQRVAGAVHGFFHIASVVPSFSHGRWKYTRNCAIFSMLNAIRHVSEVPLQTAIIGSMALQAFQPGSCCFVRCITLPLFVPPFLPRSPPANCNAPGSRAERHMNFAIWKKSSGVLTTHALSTVEMSYIGLEVKRRCITISYHHFFHWATQPHLFEAFYVVQHLAKVICCRSQPRRCLRWFLQQLKMFESMPLRPRPKKGSFHCYICEPRDWTCKM